LQAMSLSTNLSIVIFVDIPHTSDHAFVFLLLTHE